MVKAKSRVVSARVKPEIRSDMERWAREHDFPITWVVKRAIELGWPLFQKAPLADSKNA